MSPSPYSPPSELVPSTCASFLRRTASLLGRLRWLAPFAGGTLAALGLVLRIRSNPEGPHSVRYAGHRVLFRARDEQALKEVLADREYAFVANLPGASLSPRILDIGAHIGTFALWCLGQAPAAHILSVEANPGTCEILRANVRCWSSAGAALRVEHAAAGAQDGETLKVRDDGPSMSHRVGPDETLSAPSLSLPTLVEFCAPNDEDIDLAKIDIEGSEEALICSHPEALRRIRAVVIELHPTRCDSERVRAVLRDAYPSIVEIGNRISTKPLLYCCRDGQSRAK